MPEYVTTTTQYHGPLPLSTPPSHFVTVHVSATTDTGTVITRVAHVSADTTIDTLIEYIGNIEDGCPFPTGCGEFCDPADFAVHGYTSPSIRPHARRITKRYPTFDVMVTDQPSSYIPTFPSSEASLETGSSVPITPCLINIHYPFIKQWSRLRCPSENYLARIDAQENCLRYQGMNLSLQRTVRIPNDGQTHLLPEGLGAFPLVSVAKYAATLPDHVRQNGGLLG
ncbi:hypothetical protein FRC02_011679 [Tulasnella sp. 418]|nr:hypothetical protein FRC02_011679 [Tulasnella sp. 418]